MAIKNQHTFSCIAFKPHERRLLIPCGLIVLFVISENACRNDDRQAKPAESGTPNPPSVTSRATLPSTTKTRQFNDVGHGAVYRTHSSPTKLRVEWRQIDSLAAVATLIANNESTHCEIQFTGRFRSNSGSDPEILENQDGDAIPATQYIYTSDSCWIEIQIGENVMQVHSADCQAKEMNGCRFESEGLLTLENQTTNKK